MAGLLFKVSKGPLCDLLTFTCATPLSAKSPRQACLSQKCIGGGLFKKIYTAVNVDGRKRSCVSSSFDNVLPRVPLKPAARG